MQCVAKVDFLRDFSSTVITLSGPPVERFTHRPSVFYF